MISDMLITYPSEHKWTEVVSEEPDSGLGKNNRTRLRSTMSKIGETTIKHSIQPLTSEILDWFIPLYTEKISTKDNPKIFDIYGTTLGKGSEVPYFALVLEEAGVPIGATIFSERKNVLSIAYRIYPNDWTSCKLQSNPSLYSEYHLNAYAWKRGYKKISHGKDRNPYGLNSHLGLAVFKLSVGCSAYLPTTPYEIKELNLEDIDTDIFVLKYPESGERIAHAVLYISQENAEKYTQLAKYPERLMVETIFRPTT